MRRNFRTPRAERRAKAREGGAISPFDGKCNRKNTARKGKGEMVRQELTAQTATSAAR